MSGEMIHTAGAFPAWRRALVSGTAISALMAAGLLFSPVSVQRTMAANECDPQGGGDPYTFACGQGPYTSIFYGNDETAPNDSSLFVFSNTQATGGGLFDSQNAVFISSNEAEHDIQVVVQHVFNGTVPNFTGTNWAAGNVSAFVVQTSGINSPITFDVDGGVFTSGDLFGLGWAHGVALATTGSGSGIDVILNDATVTGGGSLGLANVTGFNIVTSGNDSPVTFSMDGDSSITGGSADGLADAHGVNIGTTGSGSGVDFELLGGSISGGSGTVGVLAHGVNISTTNTGANITFETAEGTTISAEDGNAVNLTASNSSILADNPINGTLESTQTALGVGVGTGFFTAAGGVGNTEVHVGPTGNVSGTGAGVIGATTGTGNVAIEIDGTVAQTMNDALPSNLILPVGVAGVAYGSGNVEVTTNAGSSVTQIGAIPIAGVEGIGVLGLAFGTGNVNVTANGDVSATGIGVAGIAAGGGSAEVNIGGDIAVDNVNGGVSPLGLLGFGSLGDGSIGGLALSTGSSATIHFNGNILGNTPDIGLMSVVLGGTDAATVDVGPTLVGPSEVNSNLIGVAGVNLGSGDVIITETPYVDPVTFAETHNTINSDGIGIGAFATAGNVSIESGIINSGSGGVLGLSGGIIGVSLGGNVDITTFGNTTTEGAIGIAAIAPAGNVGIDLRDTTLSAVNGGGIFALADGEADIEARNSTILSDGTGIVAIGADVYVDSGVITSQNGSGVIAAAIGGDAIVDTHGKITADNGIFGAAAFSVGGSAVVTVGADIDPPLIGASAFTFGAGPAIVDVLAGFTVEADLIGVAATNIGSGNVLVDIGANATIDSGGIGIAATNIGGGGSTIIDIAGGAEVFGDVNAISVQHFTPDGPAEINNSGLVQGNGVLAPVIFAATSSGLVINNDATGVIQGNLTAAGSPLGPFESIVFSIGGPAEINNAGNMHGNVTLLDLSGTGNVINNSGYWETGGINTLLSGTGNDAINNTGTVEANFFTMFIVDNFNNDGGLLSTQDGGIDDLTIVTGNFNGSPSLAGGSTLAFDAALMPGGTADLLVVGDDVTGVTLVDVNDLDGGPGQYDPDGILFAMVGGATDTTNFTTDGGIDKGLFRYDAYLRETPLNGAGLEEWVLASTLDREAFEFPVITYGAQNLWYASTGTWLDRTADLRAGFMGHGGGGADIILEPETVVSPYSVTPGVWGRVFGGTFQRDMSNVAGPPPGLLGPSYTYEDTFHQTHLGFMAGVDFGNESVTESGVNQAWMFGLMGGYTGSELGFDNSNTDVEYRQGSIGAYATYLRGGFFADLAVKGDFGKIKYHFNDGNFEDRFDADYRSIGAILDTGYRFDMASGWFVEPKATLAYVHTSIDDATVLGTGVAFQDGESIRGRLGARVGGSFVSNGSVIEPYIEASAWNEFSGDYTATLMSNGFSVPVGYDAGGTYGEVVAGASLMNMDNGWNVFGRGSVQFGDNGLLGYSGNVGVRKNW